MAVSLEVCIDSVQSAVNAKKGGACRLELCGNLFEGGTTPTIGMLKVVKQSVRIPVFAMLRPRGGDFLYNEDEFEVMKEDLKQLKHAGADGIVLGILNRDGTVDFERCQELIALARPLPVTFHRAIDMTCDLSIALEQVIRLGCERVLTSGGESSALEGVPVIRKLTEQAADRTIVMPGGGIHDRNIQRIIEGTGAQEFHATARSTVQSAMQYQNSILTMGASLSSPEFSLKYADSDKIKALIGRAQEC